MREEGKKEMKRKGGRKGGKKVSRERGGRMKMGVTQGWARRGRKRRVSEVMLLDHFYLTTCWVLARIPMLESDVPVFESSCVCLNNSLSLSVCSA